MHGAGFEPTEALSQQISQTCFDEPFSKGSFGKAFLFKEKVF